MTSPNDAATSERSASLGSTGSNPGVPNIPRIGLIAGSKSPVGSISSLPFRSPSSTSSLFTSTSTPPDSRSITPNGGIVPPRLMTSSVFGGTSTETGFQAPFAIQPGDTRYLIQHAFVPHVAIYSSSETDDLMRDKGFPHGLWQLLRPFGEHVRGKVVVRDSVGASRTYDDFAVRFIQLGAGLEEPVIQSTVQRSTETSNDINSNLPISDRIPSLGSNMDAIESVVNKHITHAESFPGAISYHSAEQVSGDAALSPFYALYLRKLLCGFPMAPHETFAHPVACIISISSRNSSPIETLRRLYHESSRGDKSLPLWVNSEYLRYYVLVHDEERDEINQSLILFEQMKRHFGLHCHLLRLRSSECVPTDDDSIQLPHCDWMSPVEELEDIQKREGSEGVENSSPYIFESDATSINTFIREMVTQSVVPSMEKCVATWNDQVASRRRGISGRFISLSKKWTGFGGGSRSNTPGASGAGSGSNSNYDNLQGFYRPDSPEALMRKLADYAFMLRDWKLAQSVYDLLRADFNNDKAWKYHAATNEMAAISTLLVSQALNARIRSESVDQMLETASYSYITRCDAPHCALRCLLLGMELLRLRNGSATDDAARWGLKILETRLIGEIGESLVMERIAACYTSRQGTGSKSWGSRVRKSALWRLLAAEQWLSLGKYLQATNQLAETKRLYETLDYPDGVYQFAAAREFLTSLERGLLVFSSPEAELGNSTGVEDEALDNIDEESEALDTRPHRRSLVGASVPPVTTLETAPLQSLAEDVAVLSTKADDFQRS